MFWKVLFLVVVESGDYVVTEFKELKERMDRCTWRHDITETLLKMVLNTIQSIFKGRRILFFFVHPFFVCPSVCLFVQIYFFLSTGPYSTWLSVHPSVRLCVLVSICPSVYKIIVSVKALTVVLSHIQ